jgi:hypothetical protein
MYQATKPMDFIPYKNAPVRKVRLFRIASASKTNGVVMEQPTKAETARLSVFLLSPGEKEIFIHKGHAFFIHYL